MTDRRSQWEDTAFFVGTLMLIAGGGLVIQAGLELAELTPVQGKLLWGGVGLVWGAVLIRVWIFREGRRKGDAPRTLGGTLSGREQPGRPGPGSAKPQARPDQGRGD